MGRVCYAEIPAYGQNGQEKTGSPGSSGASKASGTVAENRLNVVYFLCCILNKDVAKKYLPLELFLLYQVKTRACAREAPAGRRLAPVARMGAAAGSCTRVVRMLPLRHARTKVASGGDAGAFITGAGVGTLVTRVICFQLSGTCRLAPGGAVIRREP